MLSIQQGLGVEPIIDLKWTPNNKDMFFTLSAHQLNVWQKSGEEYWKFKAVHLGRDPKQKPS